MILEKEATMKPETFYSLSSSKIFPLSDQQRTNLNAILNSWSRWNEKINLTAITDKKKSTSNTFMIRLHPSYKAWFQMKLSNFLISGLGQDFPSLPMKILYPQLDDLIDSLNKRINFLNYWPKSWIWTEFTSIMDVQKTLPKTRTSVLSLIWWQLVLLPVCKSYRIDHSYLKVGGKLLALKASNAPQNC